MLFGRIVDALSGALPAGVGPAARALAPLVGAWVGFGLFVIFAATLVAWYADRLSHRRRNMVLADYFEHVLQLPLAYHAGAHSGRQMKVMLTGTDTLWWLWLSFFREHLSAFVFIVLLLPATLVLNWRLALPLIVLCVAFTILTAFIIHKSFALQRAVERHYSDLAETAADALGNVALVQSYARVELEVSGLKTVVNSLLNAQMPVLSWWAIATVLTRAGTTLTLLVILLTGTYLKLVGLASVGQIVSFMAIAAMLITRLEQAVSFSNRLFMDAPKLADFFGVLDTVPAVRDRACGDRPRPRARLGRVQGRVVLLRRQAVRGGGFELHSAARRPRGAGRPDRQRQIDGAGAALSRVRSAIGRDRGRRHGHSRLNAVGAAPQYRRRVPGDAVVQSLDRREPARRQAGRQRRRIARGGGAGAGARIHRPQSRWARGAGRRARPAPVRRRTAAARDRARAVERPADSDPRRGDQRARSGHRGAGQSARSTK